MGTTLYETIYAYDKDSRTTQVAYDDEKVEYVYDDLGRLTTRTATNGAAYPTAYAYLPGSATNSTTSLISQITHGSGDNTLTYAYTYDSRGNITTETRNGLTTTYHYDNLGQLVRVDDPHESATWVYTYDLGGNILSKAKYALNDLTSTPETTSFTYGDTNWKDKLTAVNGVAITYDAIGNPLSDGEWNYEWQAGRQLAQMANEDVTVEFAYDHNGLRTQKIVTKDGVKTTTNYTLHGKLITHMTQGSDTLHFYYDANSRPAMVNFNGEKYTYVHNLQGDIVAILDNAGTIVVEYSYDAWGRIIATTGSKSATLGKLNPFRYRGYVYDEETGLYYLRNRYYHSTRIRCINRDLLIGDMGALFSYNGYYYAKNNPLILGDESGLETVYILYDGRPDESEGGKGFPIQTAWLENLLTSRGFVVEKEGFTSIPEFIDDWNNMPDADNLLIVAHGAEGTLDCAGERLGLVTDSSGRYEIRYTSSSLNAKNIRDQTILLTCNGATPGLRGVSFAQIIANKTNSPVGAAYRAKVNYMENTGWPYLGGNSQDPKTWIERFLFGKWTITYPARNSPISPRNKRMMTQ